MHHPDNRRSLTPPLALTGLALAVLLGAAGPLNPPAGPIVGTAKTIADVSPRTAVNAENTPGNSVSTFRITQPGTYYLTGNIQGVAGKHGVMIAADDVTLDLNGFDMVGVFGNPTSGVTVEGVGRSNITVRNGSARNWGDRGIDARASNCRVSGVHAENSGESGIYIGDGGTVSGCVVTTSFNGIQTAAGCTVTGCSLSSNNRGITVQFHTTISNCSVGSSITYGISTSSDCTVTGCTVMLSGTNGISCQDRNTIRDNTLATNGSSGGVGAGVLVTGAGSTIFGNHCTGADWGIKVDTGGNVIRANTCANNTTDWVFVVGNTFNQVIDRRNTGAAAVIGESATSSILFNEGELNISF